MPIDSVLLAMARPLLILLGLFAVALLMPAAESQLLAERGEYFERKIRPLLSEHCYSCHSARAKTVHGGLQLDSADAIKLGGDSGSVLDPGNPETSLLIRAVQYDGELQMPPDGKLAASEIEKLIAWVRSGAYLPPSTSNTRGDAGIDFVEGRKFWSFQPLQEQPLPGVHDSSWPRTRLDFFALARMERAGLSPAPRADRATLIRRLSFDLTGLPPQPAEVRAFLQDRTPRAYDHLVDRLLDSPVTARNGADGGSTWPATQTVQRNGWTRPDRLISTVTGSCAR